MVLAVMWWCFAIEQPLLHAFLHSQVTLYGNVVCVAMNGGWNYPGVDYILKRIHSEVTLADDDMESE